MLLEEARQEYNSECESIENIDTRASGVLRTSILLIGLVISAFSIAGTDVVGLLTAATVAFVTAALLSLTIASFVAIVVTSVSEYPSGVGPEMRDTLLQLESSNFVAKARLMDQYHVMAAETEDEVEWNSSLLTWCQSFLFIGISLLLGAAALAVWNLSPDNWLAGVVVGVGSFSLTLLIVKGFITGASIISN